MPLLQPIIHYSLHFIAPVFIAFFLYKSDWKKAYLIFLSTMLVDIDHLLANPIFDPNRCSVGFHILHSYYAIVVYALAFIFVKNPIVKYIALGLLFHMFTDTMDCLMSKYW